MEKFLENLKEELNEISDIQPMITVKRSDLENLIKAYEKPLFSNREEIEAIITALKYYESEFGSNSAERQALLTMQKL
ncbi:hypothetical protein [Planococcus sp. YIM B11945]|uniref:hypothetical protein n=1 Tax=Planococcus sp. YIM B11945 TaxID=3435410 RepID=UPI003D7E2EC9